MFQTSIAGSLRKPAWLKGRVHAFEAHLARAELQSLATGAALARQRYGATGVTP